MVIAKLMLKAYGYNPPDINDWIQWAKCEDWLRITRKFEAHFTSTSSPGLGSVTLFRNGVHGLGVGTVVEDGLLLLVHHRRGVITTPLASLRHRQYSKLRA